MIVAVFQTILTLDTVLGFHILTVQGITNTTASARRAARWKLLFYHRESLVLLVLVGLASLVVAGFIGYEIEFAFDVIAARVSIKTACTNFHPCG